MLLQRLIEYADRQEDLEPPLYSNKWVRYVVELDGQGRLLNPEPLDLSEMQDGQRRGQQRPVPHTTRSANIQPLLLADHAEYTFGLGREKSKPERVIKSHDAYMELLEACATQTEDLAVAAVLSFLLADPLAQLNLSEDFDRGEIIIFRVGDQFAHQRPAVKKFWIDRLTPEPTSPYDIMECIICGEEKRVLKSLKGKIKGVPGGQTAGTAIISANKPAFESYGLKRSHIAPTCLECSDRFTKALNYLLRDDASHIGFSSLIFTFWTRQQLDFSFAGWFKDPDPQAVRALINSVRSGKWNRTVDETEFYAVSLSGSGGRAVVRDWIDTTVGHVKASLTTWFQGQQVVDAWGQEPRPLSIYALAGATERNLQDVAPPTYRILLRAGMVGSPLPWNLLQQAIRRNQVERDVTRSRAALIKLVLVTQAILKEDEMVQLQTEHPEPAYHCGRLLAVLESIQRAALGDISATIVDRYYGTASTAPASVFGRLVRGAQPHLSKLGRDRPGAAYALQERLEEVLATLAAFPHTLNLKEQGFFALGYYHQRADDRAKARAYRAQEANEEME